MNLSKFLRYLFILLIILPIRIVRVRRIFRTTKPVWHPRFWADIFTFLTKCFLRFSLHVFFREIHVLSLENVPDSGPVIFVGNHPNQFIDGMLLFAHVPRRLGFMIAQKSLSKLSIRVFLFFIGGNCLPVLRPQDLAQVGVGRLICIEDFLAPGSPNRARGSSDAAAVADSTQTPTPSAAEPPVRRFLVRGLGTSFEEQVQPGSQLALRPRGHPEMVLKVVRVVSSDEVIAEPSTCDTAFESIDSAIGAVNETAVSEGQRYSIRPKVDHTQLYQSVYTRLESGGSLAMFPEGGSHDNPHLLPLKAGCAMFALGAAASRCSFQPKTAAPQQECAVSDLPPAHLRPVLVPFGLTYYHGHRFRSRVFLEIGEPIRIDDALLLRYMSSSRDEKHAATDALMARVERGIRDVTVEAENYDEMTLVHSLRQLYVRAGPAVGVRDHVLATRALADGFRELKRSPGATAVFDRVALYVRKREEFLLTDSQVCSIRRLQSSGVSPGRLLAQRIVILLWSAFASIPAVVVGLPPALICWRIAVLRQQADLRKSSVKVKGLDVVASYKLLTGIGLLPLTLAIYATVFAYWRGSVAAFFYGIFGLTALAYASLQSVDFTVIAARSLIPLIKTIIHRDYSAQLNSLYQLRCDVADEVALLLDQNLPRTATGSVARAVRSRSMVSLPSCGSSESGDDLFDTLHSSSVPPGHEFVASDGASILPPLIPRLLAAHGAVAPAAAGGFSSSELESPPIVQSGLKCRARAADAASETQ